MLRTRRLHSRQRSTLNGTWDSAVPYTALIAPDGRMLYRKIGSVDVLKLRRKILAELPSEYAGFNRYWIPEK
ncbi:MAG: hypothetical protein ABSC08_05965 [Bryobacteraceae bacterium]